MLEIKHLSKVYQETILEDISITLPNTGMVIILGESGCGKTTLLNIIGGLDTHYQGEIYFNQQNIKDNPQYCYHIGYLFQDSHLIEWLPVYQNITLPKYFRCVDSVERIKEALETMQLSSFKKKRIVQLSGGQKQRVALLRATSSPVNILLCDEPTASLDKDNADEVFQLLKQQAKDKLVIVVTHCKELAEKYGDYCLLMEDGKITTDIEISIEIEHHFMEIKKQKWHTNVVLAMLQAMSKWKRNIKICSGISLALLCILLTFTLSTGLQKEIKKQLHQILPTTMVTMTNKEKKPIPYVEIDKVSKDALLKNIYVEVEGYEFLGIGKSTTYNEQEVLYIGDTTKASPAKETLEKGNVTIQSNDIILSKSTAKHLSKGEDTTALLNTSVYGWYIHGEVVKYKELQIVGISNESTMLDTIYYPTFSNVTTIKELFGEKEIFASLAIIEIQNSENTEEAVKALRTQYSQFDFIVSSKTLENQIDNVLQQVHLVLLCFCMLAIISSCFLIGEVLFLSNVERIKEIGVFKCFGATKKTICSLTLYEAIGIITVSFGMAYMLFEEVLAMVNMFVKESLGIEGIEAFISMDYTIIVTVYVLALLLALLSSIIPAVYAAKTDVIKALKQ